jgi:sporulation protein YhbH
VPDGRGGTQAVASAVFRAYSASDALRSDRSARDRQRHRQKVRTAIRENIADIVAEEAIISQRRDKIIKVPIRGIKEYRFVYGDLVPGVGTGTGDTKPGQVVGQVDGSRDPGQAGNQRGVDYYETDVTLEELIEIMFEDLELPDLERKRLSETVATRPRKPKGQRRVGIRVRLDKRRTALARIRRRVSSGLANSQREGGRFPFHREDLRYRRMREEPRPQSNAVVLCIMDTSGSMDTIKKYLARSFFFLLYHFVRTRYANVNVVFIAHDTEAREVTEDEFFRKGESGGTRISSGYTKALEVIQARYHPTLWNIYAFHCSDGDNFTDDNTAALKAAEQLCEAANLFGYGEIRPSQAGFHTPMALEMFRTLKAPNFQAVLIERAEDVWPNFKALLSHEGHRPHARSSAW